MIFHALNKRGRRARKGAACLAVLLMSTAAGLFYARAEMPPAESRKPAVSFIDMRGIAGSYLAGRFAQSHHDWDRASTYLGNVLKTDPDNPELLKRAMVLAMGAGEVDSALALASRIDGNDPQGGSLALLFLSLDAFRKQDYESATRHLSAIPYGGMTEYLTPLLKAWAQAGRGAFHPETLPDNSLGAYHAVLLAHAMGEKAKLPALAKKATDSQGLPARDLQRIADIVLDVGANGQALEIYKDLQAERPDDPALALRIAAAEGKANNNPPDLLAPLTPGQGAAEALFDMAGLLFGEYSDDSARVFAQMALTLDPGMDQARVLLAHIAARNERYDEAIKYFQAIRRDDAEWLDAQRRAADLMERSGRRADALGLLTMLVRERDDLDSLIQIGDLHRRAEENGKALEAYDRALRRFGSRIPDSYWHLLYARGMTFERLGRWKDAESDLLAALARQPDHPYILNYLGYGWADRGENLDRALEMLEQAAALRPADGYIADSLGWALYRMGQYPKALAPLEKAVGMLPDDPVVNDHLGDVYWKVGRKMEARFQWERAANFTKDPALSLAIAAKLRDGLADTPPPPLRQAGSEKPTPSSPVP